MNPFLIAPLSFIFTISIWRLRLFKMLSLALPLIVYAGVLNLPLPDVLGKYVSLIDLVVIVILSPALFWAYRRANWVGMLLSLALTLGLFAIHMSLLWSGNINNHMAIWGLLPLSDASSYYHESRRLLEGFLLTSWGGRRPLFHVMLATLLGLTGQNLQMTLAILVAINAVACFLAVREIQRSHGTAVAIVALALLYFFSCTWNIGITMSENLGLALGAVSFALLWRGAYDRRQSTIWIGLFFLTIALSARSGAFLVLPALIFGGAWSFRGQKRLSWHFLGWAFGAVALGFLLNVFVSNLVISPGVVFNGNFADTLYGLAVGGKGWKQAALDYPGVSALGVYKLTFQVILDHPTGLLIGLIKGLFYFFARGFDFITGVRVLFKQLSLWKLTALMFCQSILWMISALGFIICWRRRSEPSYSLLGAAILGIIASAPVLAMDGGNRVFAATIPFTVALVAVGVHSVITRAKCAGRLNNPVDRTFCNAPLVFGVVLVLIMVIGTLVIRGSIRSSTLEETPCPPGQEMVFVRLTPGSSIKLVEDSVVQRSWLPNIYIRLRAFRHLNPVPSSPGFEYQILRLGNGNSLLNALDLKTGRLVWLAIPASLFPNKPGVVEVCGVGVLSEEEYHLINAVSVTPKI